MKAIVMFDRDKLDWHLVQLNLAVDFDMTVENIKRGFTSLGRIRFPHILEVEINAFKFNGGVSYSWSSSELPDTPDINECIKKNKADILLAMSKLKIK